MYQPEENYGEHLRRIIEILKLNREPSKLREHVVAMLEAAIQGDAVQIGQYEDLMKLKRDELISPWKEALDFDVDAEVSKWKTFKARHESDLSAIQLK